MDVVYDSVKEYYQDVNAKLALICRIMIFLMALVIILNYMHVFVINSIIYPVLLFSMAVLFLPTILYHYLHVNNQLLQYLVLTLIVFMSGLLYAILSYHVIIMLIFPVVVACLYCDKNSFIYTSLLGIPVIVISHFVAYYLHIVPDEPLITLHGVVFYGILPRLIEYLAISIICYTMTDKIQNLIGSLTQKNNELYQEQKSLIMTLSQVTEIQSKETGQHIKRVSEYTRILCEGLNMNEQEIDKVTLAAMMHDIGKISIPKEILEKPSRLTEEEFNIIKTHVVTGRNLLKDTQGELMQISAIIAYEHHEKWDGSGYLHKKGEEIHLYARCVAIGDVFDALVSKRVYKDAWDINDAKNEIILQSGHHFDPNLVDIFVRTFDRFIEIYQKYPDDN